MEEGYVKGVDFSRYVDNGDIINRRTEKENQKEMVTYLLTSMLPKVSEISSTSTSSGVAERAKSMARTSSIP
jgi:hypothetical protein